MIMQTQHLVGMCSNMQNSHSVANKELEDFAPAILRATTINCMKNVAHQVLWVEDWLAMISVEDERKPESEPGGVVWLKKAKLTSHRKRGQITTNVAHPLYLLQPVAGLQHT